jgi:flagella basal body P-ring formation protein FlgA
MKRLLLVLSLWASLAGAAWADPLVALKTTSEVRDTTIHLGDVFDGVPVTIDRAIATAPQPGKSVTYDVRILTRLAEQYRLDWKPQSLVDRAVITRASTHITQDMVRGAVLKKLSENLSSSLVDGKTDIAFDNRSVDLDLPPDRAPDFTLNGFSYDPRDRRFHAELTADTGNAVVSLPLSGRVLIKRDMAVFARRVEAGTVLAETDLNWVTVPEEKLTTESVTDPAQVVGREQRRTASEGQPVRARDLSAPRLVMRGGLVTLKVETPYLLITAQGRALQDGGQGDVVRVTNTQSNRTVEGTVVAPGVVKVGTALRVAVAGKP